jgi:thiamine biosynthesis lipoprotein
MSAGMSTSAQDVHVRISRSAHTAFEGGLHKLGFQAMATRCAVHFHGVPASLARDFQVEVVRWVSAFEARYSRFIPESLVGRINAAAGEHWVETDAETDRLFAFCQDLYFFTRGVFDPTALPLIKLWNWKTQPAALPGAEAIREARELVGWNKVMRRPGGIFLPQRGMSIDLGGIGKEYAVDCVMNMAIERGIGNVLVDFGQDVRVRGTPPEKPFWWIGLEDPNEAGKCWAGVAVTDHAVATSGDYVRCFVVEGRRYGHILDPRTGYPADSGCRAASVVAPSCTIAGLLSTTALILGPKEGLQLIETHPGAAGAITTDKTRLCTRRFGEFSPTGSRS